MYACITINNLINFQAHQTESKYLMDENTSKYMNKNNNRKIVFFLRLLASGLAYNYIVVH